MQAVTTAFARVPGKGQFTCCMRNHELPARSDGEKPISIPCDRITIGQLLVQMLKKRSEYEMQRGKFDHSRIWKALAPHFGRF